MTREEAIKYARATISNEETKEIFDQLVKLYPDTYVWAECGDEHDEIYLDFKNQNTVIKIKAFE
jgi:hypothetical protein